MDIKDVDSIYMPFYNFQSEIVIIIHQREGLYVIPYSTETAHEIGIDAVVMFLIF